MKMKKKKDRKKMKENDNGVVIVAVDNYNTLTTHPTTTTGSNYKGNNNKILHLFVLFLIVGISTIFYDSKYISNYQIMTKMKSNDLIYNVDDNGDGGVVNNVRENGPQSQISRDNDHQQQQQQQQLQQNQTDMSFEEVMREKKKKDEEDTDTDDDDDNDSVDRRPYLILHGKFYLYFDFDFVSVLFDQTRQAEGFTLRYVIFFTFHFYSHRSHRQSISSSILDLIIRHPSIS